MRAWRCWLSSTKKVAWAYSSPRAKAPSLGSASNSGSLPASSWAGSSPTIFTQRAPASGLVMNLRNFTAASIRAGSAAAFLVMPWVQ